MTAREQAEELKQQAIDLLLKERNAIEAELKALGYCKENGVATKRRGRPPKATLEASQAKEHQAEFPDGDSTRLQDHLT
jgi:hypothetical protein